MSVTEFEFKSLLLRTEESRATIRKVRVELTLQRNVEEETSLETREASGKVSSRRALRWRKPPRKRKASI